MILPKVDFYVTYVMSQFQLSSLCIEMASGSPSRLFQGILLLLITFVDTFSSSFYLPFVISCCPLAFLPCFLGYDATS